MAFYPIRFISWSFKNIIMKSILKISACIFLSGMLIFTSCKKDPPPPPPPPPPSANRPPVANAGPDQTITISTNTINLNGSGSTDPDNNITTYAWRGIFGSSSLNIANANGVQASVTNFTTGIHSFELKVTDAGGLFSKDTVYIDVLRAGSSACIDTSINVVNGVGTFTSYGSLSQIRLVTPAAAADKIVFFGGAVQNNNNPYTPSDQVDIYNLSTNTWSAAKLSEPMQGDNLTVGNKILFFADTKIDIYDAVANTWLVIPMDKSIIDRGATRAVINNKVFFAGGLITDVIASNRIDIYDVAANTWTSATLSEARAGITPVTVGNKLILAGGYKKWDQNASDDPQDPSKRVDIYDASANSWSTGELPQPACNGTAAAINNKAVFHFNFDEYLRSSVNIYDVATNGWLTVPFSEKRRYDPLVMAAGNKILIAAGLIYGAARFSKRVDIYDAVSNSWSVATLSHGEVFAGKWLIGSKLIFKIVDAYSSGGDKNLFDVYDASTNAWSTIQLNYNFNGGGVVANNQLFFGGVSLAPVGSQNYQTSCKVFKFQF